MTVGERIVHILKGEGVSCIFSQGELSLREVQKHALAQGIKLVGPRHEAAGIWMAAAYYRMTGIPQVAMGAQGPGVANLLPAAVWAAQEHIPVVIIGASRQLEAVSGTARGQFLVEEPLQDCFKRICKFARRIIYPAHVDEIMWGAFREALSGTPGPVYVELDYANQTDSWQYEALAAPHNYRVVSQAAAEEDVKAAALMLLEADSLLLVGGEQIHSTRAHDEFLRLARLLGCPVITTFSGAGAIRQTDPQWLDYASAAAMEAIASADVVLSVGSCIPENINYGKQRHFAPGNETRRWIQLDTDPAAIGRNRRIDHAVIGSLPESLSQLCAALQAGGGRSAHPRLAEWRAKFEAERDKQWASVGNDVPIDPNRLMLEAREAVPDDAVIISDSGFTIVYQHDCFEKRGNDFIWGAYAAHLGTGLPQAIGAKLAVGDKLPVCLLIGDGGLGVHIMELETAIRHELPIVIVVNDDQAFAAELAALVGHFEQAPECYFVDARFDRIIEALGGHGEYVDQPGDIGPAIRRAFESGRTALVQVRTNQQSGLEHMPFSGPELYSWVHEYSSCMERTDDKR